MILLKLFSWSIWIGACVLFSLLIRELILKRASRLRGEAANPRGLPTQPAPIASGADKPASVGMGVRQVLSFPALYGDLSRKSFEQDKEIDRLFQKLKLPPSSGR